ncbi:MAG: radical SAM family heme chaperone HemW [Bacteroidales bacterium]|nr:radical SAM family heme chaperone HemW [Bacteroidales bacterium]
MAGIYIHIPFCKQKCHYCNFFSQASTKHKQAFILALLHEIELQKEYLGGEKIKTIYLGGGTPSLLSDKEIKLIFKKIGDYFELSTEVEITLEANPDDLNKEYLSKLNETEINRLSIGIQSFHDDDLQYLNRVHTGQQALNSLQNARLFFENLSIDLIYGIPTLNHKKWSENLNAVFQLNIPHISTYALTVEPKTALDLFIKKGKYATVKDQSVVDHFHILCDAMESNGYEHYEISNFSKKKHQSLHNTSYWSGSEYLGLGPSAHSFNGVSRQWNIANTSQYIESLQRQTIPFTREILSKQQKYNEYVMTSLRTIRGTDANYILQEFGNDRYDHFLKEVVVFQNEGKINQTGSTFTLTRQGKLFADQVTASLF